MCEYNFATNNSTSYANVVHYAAVMVIHSNENNTKRRLHVIMIAHLFSSNLDQKHKYVFMNFYRKCSNVAVACPRSEYGENTIPIPTWLPHRLKA